MQSGRKIKNQRGFTLVEVIVVAVIVAALAGVAIPMYTSYVASSRDNAAANAAGSVASFMGACINRGNAVTGITEAVRSAGTETDLTIFCNEDEPTETTMKLPLGIRFEISDLDGPGTVEAQHIDSDSTLIYNY